MKKLTLAITAAFIATIASPPSSLEAGTKIGGFIKGVTGKKSTTDHLKELQALALAKETLVQIEETRKSVAQKEKEAIAFARKQELALNALIKESEKSLDTLRENAKRKADQRKVVIQAKIDQRQGNIAELKKALTQTSAVSTYSALASRWIPFGSLNRVDDYVQSQEATYKDELQEKIGARRKSISKLSDLLAAEHKATKDLFSDPAYLKAVEEITLELNQLKKGFSKLSAATARYRQATVFDVYNKQADTHLATLEKAIADAKCTKMPTRGEAKTSIITICQKNRLGNRIKKARKTSACSALDKNTPSQKIAACIKAYRTENNLRG